MITTTCNEINWMAEKATKYFSDSYDTVYQFKGNIPFRMLRAAQEWMKENNAHKCTGNSRASYSLKLKEIINLEDRTYYKESINLQYGTMKGNNTSVVFQVTISSYALTDEDIAELTK